MLKIQYIVSAHTFLVWNDERTQKKKKMETKRVIQIKANYSIGIFFLFRARSHYFSSVLAVFFRITLLRARMSKRLIIFTNDKMDIWLPFYSQSLSLFHTHFSLVYIMCAIFFSLLKCLFTVIKTAYFFTSAVLTVFFFFRCCSD